MHHSFPDRPAGPDEVVLDTKDLQALTFDLLLALDAFCAKHSIPYYLCGGTLLGAVRHGGFIPWDDDVDVFMARPDYDRFVELASSKPVGKQIEFACAQNGKFYRPFARLYDLRTSLQRKYYIPESGSHAWIDILPVDGLPSSREALEKLYERRNFYARHNFNAFWRFGRNSRKLYVLRRMRSYPLSMLLGAKGWCAKLDALSRKIPYAEADTVGCLSGGRYGIGEAMDKRAYETPVSIDFCGRSFKTMSCWREYLTNIYGDYMTPPPPEKRSSHLDYVTMRKVDYETLCAAHPELREKRAKA